MGPKGEESTWLDAFVCEVFALDYEHDRVREHETGVVTAFVEVLRTWVTTHP